MQPPQQQSGQGLMRYHISQQQTAPQPMFAAPQQTLNMPNIPVPNPNTPIPFNAPNPIFPNQPVSVPVHPPAQSVSTPTSSKKKLFSRSIAVLIVIGLAIAIYLIWHTTPTTAASPADITQQGFSSSGTPGSATDGIRVYVVGAVKHPGVYTLQPGARVYDLIQAAGGALPKANLVALNMAAKLSDGQEVYVIALGESPPTYTGGVPGTGSGGDTGGGTPTGGTSDTSGQLVNINTASVDELSQNLHVSKTSAQAIVDYRTQHGNYSSVDQLSQVVSKYIYDKIKSHCTV